MSEIVELLVNNGIAVVVVGYFLFRDYRYTSEQIKTLTEIQVTLETLSKRILKNEDNNGSL